MFNSVRKPAVLLAVGLCLLCFVPSIQAQYIAIDTPDDTTFIDTTYVPPQQTSVVGDKTSFVSQTALTAAFGSISISTLNCSGFPNMCAYVDALDLNGFPISGLTADSFCVKQDSIAIGTFSVQRITNDSCMASICLVVDVSGSMADAGKLDSAKAAMHRFVNAMGVYDRTAIVPYSNCIGTVTNFTSDKTTLHNAINALTSQNYTACYDGIYKGVSLTRTELGSKAVIAFTDGLENRSQYCSQPPDGVNDHSYADDSTLICNLANGSSCDLTSFGVD